MAADIADVIGGAIALNLLFDIPRELRMEKEFLGKSVALFAAFLTRR